MSVYRVNPQRGKEPSEWSVEKFAAIPYEDWVKQIVDLNPLVDAGSIMEPQREAVKDAIASILFEGLMPAYLELQTIRNLSNSGKPILEQWQPYEDFARKLWKAHKELMQNAARLMGYEIGFLFQKEEKFRKGLADFRLQYPTTNKGFEGLFEWVRKEWQERLADFRNSVLEHRGGDRKDFEDFYKPENAEILFALVWKSIANILPMLLELKLMNGMRLIEQHPNDPGPRWNQRFMYQPTGVKHS